MSVNEGLRLQIAGTGSYLPETVIPNSYFVGRPLNKYDLDGNLVESKILTDEGIVRVTGIRERRRSNPGTMSSDLGYIAAERAMADAGVDPDSLVGIIFSTVTEDKNFPNGAAKIQKRLGAKNCFAYDMANACAGFPEALMQANSRVLRRPGNYLVVAAECLWNMVDEDDVNSTLFGEGAGAVVLKPTYGPAGFVAEYSISNPFDGKDSHIFRDKKRIMRMPDGDPVMKSAVREMVKSVEELKRLAGWNCADLIIPHQANIRIIEPIARRVGKDGTKVFVNIERYGNMSTATTAIGLDEARKQGLIIPSSDTANGTRVILTAFGASETTSAVAYQA